MVSTSPNQLTEERPPSWRIWLQAIRPATLAAGAVPVWVGTMAAQADGVAQPGPAIAACIGAILLQIGCNLANDFSDFIRGADTEARIGPARVTRKGWISPNQIRIAAFLVFTMALGVGFYLTLVGGWPIVVIGLASILAAVLYTGGPRSLGYMGLGDVLVFIFFGVIGVSGTYYVQALTLTVPVVLLSTAIGALATAILVVNNLRDRETDATAGKNTLAVRFGAGFARGEYATLLSFAYGITIVTAGVRAPASWGLLLPLLTLPLALVLIGRLWRQDGAALNPLLGATARLEALFGLLLGVGVIL